MYEEYHTERLGVSHYHGYASKTPEQWAEMFGRRAIAGMVGHESVDVIADDARMAARFAALALEGGDA